MPTTYAIPNGRTVMDATLYTGNGSTQTIVNTDQGTTGFKPDLVWVKRRNNSASHRLGDSVRGVNNSLYSNSISAEVANDANGYISAITTTGFTVSTGSTDAQGTNFNGDTYVGWQWQAGQGTNTSNTSGSITSTVSVNATAGFSIATYTGNFTAGATVGHGLGVAPQLIIIKKRSASGNWITYHVSTGINQYLLLNATDAAATATPTWGANSSTFTLQQSFNDYNTSGATYVAYCWTPIAGFSQFGSYTANASADGPFIYTGFRPAFVMFKKSSGVGDWMILDNQRNTYNVELNFLLPNSSNAEAATANRCDFLSNGIKVRAPSGYTPNETAGDTYVYAAFAENPFKYSNAR
jgi:hypothetical protein